MAVRTRQVYDTPKFTGYEVVIPVWQDVFASGILLVPKGLKPGERRPVVVTQHGLDGQPKDVVEATNVRSRVSITSSEPNSPRRGTSFMRRRTRTSAGNVSG